jgi:hypothetical protein
MLTVILLRSPLFVIPVNEFPGHIVHTEPGCLSFLKTRKTLLFREEKGKSI